MSRNPQPQRPGQQSGTGVTQQGQTSPTGLAAAPDRSCRRETVQMNAVGAAIVMTVSEAGFLTDLSLVTSISMYFRKPNGDVIERDAQLFTNGTDGKVEYMTEPGFLDRTGRWACQAEVAWAGGFIGRSDIQFFYVMPIL